MNRRHVIGDHHGRSAGHATLLVRAVDAILDTHTLTPDHVRAECAQMSRLHFCGAALNPLSCTSL